ncbi:MULTISPECIES: ABC transporter ATP-binding protein [Agrobacterium]|uniref:ABC transporter ATP-binding protein n=1 Tax=Agrobacterium rubi TaxID=28099 RepID=A0AAE7UQW0_9HYPH|nr:MULTISPECIES: ABC transporter ATP-binding protein [Agrobacterium]MBN7807858.1 ABC transporter ATP-binding protein [Agrobacterium rosae]NTE89818.1 ABC transporter ATP-binding protein [Agrobacterium rubi]NTF05332.1 ABC transporter ATP-binding protein [Agrobacterium rubi]NTF39776.1 ABC transporter ATP-binding protein [Agrobacterium rubi]OCJ44914.1 ABC transporter ATP-binding protein [Agrobacterium rubi]
MTKAILTAENLCLKFGGVVAADNANLTVNEGDRIAIIGPNGAGKTTFINMCTGYLIPISGTVTFDGADVTGRSPRSIVKAGVGRSFQLPQLFLDNTVLDNLLLALSAREETWSPWMRMRMHPKRQEMLDLLEVIGLAQVKDRTARELPEGMRKLIDVAMALALKPRLVFMDEPTSGVSSNEKFQVMDTIVAALSKGNTSAIFVEHDMDVVSRYANRVAVWTGGKIALEGTPEQVLNDPDVRKNVIGE